MSSLQNQNTKSQAVKIESAQTGPAEREVSNGGKYNATPRGSNDIVGNDSHSNPNAPSVAKKAAIKRSMGIQDILALMWVGVKGNIGCIPVIGALAIIITNIMMIDMAREVLSDTMCILSITSPGLAPTIPFVQKGAYETGRFLRSHDKP
ncbi:hypothetical protein IFM47457_08383 [Aspergillus lentulus]|nr:hypothetical protein IFM62136_06956 [Aspergillus lentulus]GFF90125.1 hypothetical protein IFM47457_08383 [Aspergillus lentulus]